jgi:hypothetical protein
MYPQPAGVSILHPTAARTQGDAGQLLPLVLPDLKMIAPSQASIRSATKEGNLISIPGRMR